MTTDLKEEFERLCDSRDAQSRGREFERLFCRLLFKSGFTVHRDSRSANPRQTDVLAEYGGDTFLFEIKWLGRRIDISAIAQIRDRLGRTPKGTIGCICSASGFTERLIKDAEQQRSQFEILLFNPYEIYGLFVQGISTLDLIDKKRRGLRRHGTIWFLEQDPQNFKSQYVELPPSYESLQISASSIHIPIHGSDFSDIVFARTPLIFDEFLWAVSLTLRLNNLSAKQLREVFTAAENYLGLRGQGTFGIRQRDSGWYGLGSDNFLKEVNRYSQRYEGYKGHIHHSEELAFFDELNDGLFLLSARQSMTREGMIHSIEVNVRLRGIPVNAQPYFKFVRSFTRYDVYFTPEPPLKSVHITLPSCVKVEQPDVVTKIESRELDRENASISGVVLKNPFFNDPAKIAEFSQDRELLAFAGPKYLICSLDDWLDLGDEIDHYVLTALETVTVGGIVLLHPRCTWGNFTKRAHPSDGSGFREIAAEWTRDEQMQERFKKASKRKKVRT